MATQRDTACTKKAPTLTKDREVGTDLFYPLLNLDVLLHYSQCHSNPMGVSNVKSQQARLAQETVNEASTKRMYLEEDRSTKLT